MRDLSLYSEIIHRTRYARWREEDRRRETWEETVKRYFDHFEKHLGKKAVSSLRPECEKAVLNMDVMPSMRTLMTAGKALESAHVANYNCAALPVDHVRAFSEHMYILMCGAGSGFSVERRFVGKLAEVPEEIHECDTVINVADSRKGWCAAYNQFLNLLWAGNVAKFDTSKVRPAGARLKTFGGYSSGPAVLHELIDHTVKMFYGARGRRLKPIEVFSIMTYIAQIVVVGGVRRSATICLFDKDDIEMRRAKSGNWFDKNQHYAMANISAVFETKPDPVEFMDIWRDLASSGAGEPGFLNRKALWDAAELIGRESRNGGNERIPFLVNPCSEIQLRPYQFCNLTGAAIRPNDTLTQITHKVKIATILGTWQATISDFEYLRKVWKDNVDEERLLGVCLAGIMDHPVLSQVDDESAKWLQELKACSWEVNKRVAKELKIAPSTCVTAIKPAGNSGELYDVSSGIHPRYAPYYVRTIRQSGGDPVTKFLMAQGIPWEVSEQNKRDVIFSFPIRSPENAIVAGTLPAVEQLKHWLHVKQNYATHTVSCTIYVKTDEWLDVGAWVFKNFDQITGIAFLPYDDHTYKQAPYQPIDAETYAALVAAMPKSVDWSALAMYEDTDTTRASQEFTCVGDRCALV